MEKVKIGLFAIICTALFLCFGCILLSQDKEISENENRVLTARPGLSVSNIMDGTFQSQLEKWLDDQFPAHDWLIMIGNRIKLLTGRRDINDTYIGKDGFLFEKVTPADIDNKRYERNLSRIESLSMNYPDIPFSVMLVPSSGIVHADKLPANAELYDMTGLCETARTVLSTCQVLDVYTPMSEARDEYIFYRTDHHWTAQGAYIGYQVFRGQDTAYSGQLWPEPASDQFLGALHSRTLIDVPPDSVTLPDVPDGIAVTADRKAIELYDASALSEKDKYRAYLGGNYGIVEISGKGEGTLLILKDSFANSFAPYLLKDYEKIIMIDMRYYSLPVTAILGGGEISQVLVLYEINNFACDRDLAKLS